MFPSQTSLIPVAVALAKFIETNGFKSFFEIYPYWYFGVPFRYLTGPFVPSLLILIHKTLPFLSLFDISIYITILFLILSSLGWGILAFAFCKNKNLSLLVFLLSLIFPWKYLSALALEETSFVISRSLLPFCLLAFEYFFASKSQKRKYAAIVAVCILLLINTSVLPLLVVGVSSLIIAHSQSAEKGLNLSKYIRLSLNILIFGLIFASLWYTPKYWFVVLTNPSIGGYSGIKVILRIFDLLKALIPLALAVYVVHFRSKIKDRLSVFGLTFGLTFLFLTFFRFVGDWDFWQDWTGWMFELEASLAILAAIFVGRVVKRISFSPKIYLLVLSSILILFVSTYFVFLKLGKPRLISREKPVISEGLYKLTEIAGAERVFISGTGVFWANALSDVRQLRGGVDKVSTHPTWDKAAWEFREGNDPEKSKKWLSDLKIKYVLVHEEDSSDFYHDFKYPAKWQEIGVEVWRRGGDVIYRIPGV